MLISRELVAPRRRMVSEKFAAAAASHAAAAAALAGDKGMETAVTLALAPAKRAVRANHRRCRGQTDRRCNFAHEPTATSRVTPLKVSNRIRPILRPAGQVRAAVCRTAGHPSYASQAAKPRSAEPTRVTDHSNASRPKIGPRPAKVRILTSASPLVRNSSILVAVIGIGSRPGYTFISARLVAARR